MNKEKKIKRQIGHLQLLVVDSDHHLHWPLYNRYFFQASLSQQQKWKDLITCDYSALHYWSRTINCHYQLPNTRYCYLNDHLRVFCYMLIKSKARYLPRLVGCFLSAHGFHLDACRYGSSQKFKLSCLNSVWIQGSFQILGKNELI